MPNGMSSDLDARLREVYIKSLEFKLRQKETDELTTANIRRNIFHLSESIAAPPLWTTKSSIKAGENGVPTLFLSDLHWGEVIDPGYVNGYNKYNLHIGQRRLRVCIERCIDLLKNHLSNPHYPGIVLALGGDLFSGDIHEELTNTNEVSIMPAFVDLLGCMISAIGLLADNLGRVFIPAVTGNHSRTTLKVIHKRRAYTSFDWLLYTQLERHFIADKRVQFYIPTAPDCLYRIHGHRYMLVHGDQFRGGDGMIGPIGPIFRGDHKKRSRNSQTGQEYDTLIMGHFHQLIPMRKMIVNGSLAGYNEYAFNNNMPFEPPSQLMWLTHPKHGITCTWPIYLEDGAAKEKSEWVSFRKAVA
jgi:hypothetical protein